MPDHPKYLFTRNVFLSVRIFLQIYSAERYNQVGKWCWKDVGKQEGASIYADYLKTQMLGPITWKKRQFIIPMVFNETLWIQLIGHPFVGYLIE